MKLHALFEAEDRPDTRDEVWGKWTKADWDELWETPTPEKVLTWCLGSHKEDKYLYMRKAKLRQISVKNNRVNFTRHFSWMATHPRLPFRLGRVNDFSVYNTQGVKIETTEGFPQKCTGCIANITAYARSQSSRQSLTTVPDNP